MTSSRDFSPAVKACVAIVFVVSLATFASLSDPVIPEDSGHFLVVLGLAVLIGFHSMRYSPSSIELSSTHPFLIYSIATFGPRAAMLIILCSIATTLLTGKSRPPLIRLAFNLAAVALSALLAGAVFVALGGVPGRPVGEQLAPLFAGAISYLVANSALISFVVSIDRDDVKFLRACANGLQWSGVAYLTGYAIGIAVLYATNVFGKPAILLVLPPCWLLLSFYKMHEARLETERLRRAEVESLNSELSRSVDELQDALRHIKQLRGLLPICMHCKSIRDDQDVWHRVEAYLAEHSDAHLTHSLCESCREIHYPDIGRKKDPTPV